MVFSMFNEGINSKVGVACLRGEGCSLCPQRLSELWWACWPFGFGINMNIAIDIALALVVGGWLI
jgi:hypothetical protein